MSINGNSHSQYWLTDSTGTQTQMKLLNVTDG